MPLHVTPFGLIIVLVIVLVLFGGGRVGKLGGELGTALKEFKRALNEGEEGGKKPEELPAAEQTPKQS
jgi:sec-independent protein translocase protein TatA